MKFKYRDDGLIYVYERQNCNREVLVDVYETPRYCAYCGAKNERAACASWFGIHYERGGDHCKDKYNGYAKY